MFTLLLSLSFFLSCFLSFFQVQYLKYTGRLDLGKLYQKAHTTKARRAKRPLPHSRAPLPIHGTQPSALFSREHAYTHVLSGLSTSRAVPPPPGPPPKRVRGSDTWRGVAAVVGGVDTRTDMYRRRRATSHARSLTCTTARLGSRPRR